MYTGKTNNVVEIGLGERVFKDFTSVPLFQDLLENKTYACGTIRTNRKYLPPAITQAKLKNQGEMVIEQKEGSIVAWHDKRTVTILSTLSNPLEMSSVKRRKKDGSQVDVPCPKAIQSHTAHMNGVDRVDQLRSSYSVSRRAAKWWKYLFWFLIDISIINGFIMMKECKPPGDIKNTQKKGLMSTTLQTELGKTVNWQLQAQEEKGKHSE